MDTTYGPPTRPSLISIAVLTAGCILGVAVQLLGVHIADSVGNPNDLTLDEVTALNLCSAGSIALPLWGVAVFAGLQPVGIARRAIGVLAPAGVSMVTSMSILSGWDYGLTDSFFVSAVAGSLVTTASVTSWVLVRRRSLATSITILAALVGGFLFHLGMAHAIIFSPNVTDLVAAILWELNLLLSVVLLAWLAVGIDAVAKTNHPSTGASERAVVG